MFWYHQGTLEAILRIKKHFNIFLFHRAGVITKKGSSEQRWQSESLWSKKFVILYYRFLFCSKYSFSLRFE